jgi:hypothetical protein
MLWWDASPAGCPYFPVLQPARELKLKLKLAGQYVANLFASNILAAFFYFAQGNVKKGEIRIFYAMQVQIPHIVLATSIHCWSALLGIHVCTPRDSSRARYVYIPSVCMLSWSDEKNKHAATTPGLPFVHSDQAHCQIHSLKWFHECCIDAHIKAISIYISQIWYDPLAVVLDLGDATLDNQFRS